MGRRLQCVGCGRGKCELVRLQKWSSDGGERGVCVAALLRDTHTCSSCHVSVGYTNIPKGLQ